MYSDFATTTEGVLYEDTNKRNRILSLWRLRNLVSIRHRYLVVLFECFLITAIAWQRGLKSAKEIFRQSEPSAVLRMDAYPHPPNQ